MSSMPMFAALPGTGSHAATAGTFSSLSGGVEALEALAALAVLVEPCFLARLDADQVAPEVPDDAVEGELGPLDAPLAEAERGLLDVDGFAIDDQRRPQTVNMRIIRPPEPGTDPVAGDLERLLRAGGHPERPGGEDLLDVAGGDREVQPFLAGEELLASPPGEIGPDVDRSRFFALDPDVVLGCRAIGRRGDDCDEK
jgi:hypothetical protein